MTTDTGAGGNSPAPSPGHFTRTADYIYGGGDRAEQAAKLLETFEPLFRSQAGHFAQYGADFQDMAQQARVFAWEVLLNPKTDLANPGLPGYLKKRVHGHLTDLFNRQVGRDRREAPELPDDLSRLPSIRKAQEARVADWRREQHEAARSDRREGLIRRLPAAIAQLPDDLKEVARHVLEGGNRRSFWKQKGLDRRRGAELYKRAMAELKHILLTDEG